MAEQAPFRWRFFDLGSERLALNAPLRRRVAARPVAEIARAYYPLPIEAGGGGLALLEDACALPGGALVAANGVAVAESLGVGQELNLRLWPLTRMPRLAGDFIYLRQQGDGDEALWLLDLLPRMAIAAQFCDLSAFKIAVRGASAIPDVIRDSLRLFGVAEEQIVALGPPPTFLQRLVYPLAAKGASLGPSLQAIEVLESFPARLPRAEDAPTRLFVAPAPGEPRLTNEAALVDVLAPLGFVRVEPARLPFKDRIRVFSRAEIVIGASRGGLANLVFASRGVRVLSLSLDRHPEAIEAATRLKDGRFDALNGAPMPGGFAIDPEALKMRLAALGA